MRSSKFRARCLAATTFVLLAYNAQDARAAILTVDTEVDTTVVDAFCSLREAIEEANRTAGMAVYVECGAPSINGADSVVFDPSIKGRTIVLASDLDWRRRRHHDRRRGKQGRRGRLGDHVLRRVHGQLRRRRDQGPDHRGRHAGHPAGTRTTG